MRLHQNNGIGFLTYDRLSEIPFIHHAFSTKIGEGSPSSHVMDMSFEHDDREKITKNYRLFCDAAGFDFESLVASSQDHHTFVRVCTKEERGIGIYRQKDIESVDALVTNERGVTLVTYYADCTPIFFVDIERRAIALAHAGWRGTVAMIAKEVVNVLKKNYNTDPTDLVCCIGPNIGRCCYEVDQPVADEFYALKEKAPSITPEDFVFPKEGGKFMADMKEANRQILLSCGVRDENIVLSDLCTQCRSDLLWSHRATKGDRGTMSAFLCLK